MKQPLLKVEGLRKHFGGLKAVDGVDFQVDRGEILGILGPNGAGKTVCFNMISGIYKPTGGRIFFDRARTDGLPPFRLAAMGLGRTFQIVKPFTSLTVLENVLVARGIAHYGRFRRIWGPWRSKDQVAAAMGILEQVGLAELAGRKAGLLPLGNLRRLEIARAMVVGRKLILLDESFSGLRHGEVSRLEDLIRTIRQMGITVLLIEHNLRVSMKLCDRIVVLDHGRKLAEGTAEQIQSNQQVIEAYLGRRRRKNAAGG